MVDQGSINLDNRAVIIGLLSVRGFRVPNRSSRCADAEGFEPTENSICAIFIYIFALLKIYRARDCQKVRSRPYCRRLSRSVSVRVESVVPRCVPGVFLDPEACREAQALRQYRGMALRAWITLLFCRQSAVGQAGGLGDIQLLRCGIISLRL